MKRLYRLRGFVLGLWGLSVLPWPPALGWLPWLGAILLLAAAAFLRVWARQYIGGHTRQEAWSAPALCTVGPYARLRHPLYASNWLAGTAYAFLHLGPGCIWLAWCALLGLILCLLALAEDRWLRERFGLDWVLWARKVPFCGWAPRASYVSPIRSAGASMRSDAWTWFWWACALVLLALRKLL